MTKNERDMVMTLAQAINSLAGALRAVTPAIADPKRQELADAYLVLVESNFEELIRLIDKEWLSDE
ncbi:hypothetical protein [Pseudoduganella chitinolytica]|uniref:Uncharacterized protein n=1 Tax=Pseudoduganella chitinolytica TaxID=34070 RepID=A0ABY8BKJ0_9BURK|nr:hypothetical protein [Pseudoduganella chitinolytica]WEF34894.1 hypothetical protein PX653_09080 [Pseudoduganella chitinolytica]